MAIVYTYPRISPGNTSLWVLITDNEDEQKTKNINFEDFAKLIPEIITLNDFKLCGHPFVPVCPVPINDGDGIFYNANSQVWEIKALPPDVDTKYVLNGIENTTTTPYSFDVILTGSDATTSNVNIRPGSNVNFTISQDQLIINATGGGGTGSPLTVSDANTTVTNTSSINFIGATVTGTTPNATVTITGNDIYLGTVPANTNVVGTWGNIDSTYVSSGGQDPAKNLYGKTISEIFDLIFFQVIQPTVTQQISSSASWTVPKQGSAFVVGEVTSVTLASATLNRGTVGNPAQDAGHNRYYGETTDAYVQGTTLPNNVPITILTDGRQDANPTFATNTLIEDPVVIPAFGQSYSWSLKIDVAGTNSNPPQPYANEPYLDGQGQVEGYWKNNLGGVATSPALAPSTTRTHSVSVSGLLPIYFGTGTTQAPYNSNNYLAANFALPSATNPIPRGSTSWTSPYQALWGGGTIDCFQPFPQITSVNQLHCFMLANSLIQNKTVNIFVWDPVSTSYVDNNSFWTTGPSGTFGWPVNTGYSSETFTPYYSIDGNQGGDPTLTRAKYQIQVI